MRLFDLDGSYVLQRADRCSETGLGRHWVWFLADNQIGCEFDHVIVALGMNIDRDGKVVRLDCD